MYSFKIFLIQLARINKKRTLTLISLLMVHYLIFITYDSLYTIPYKYIYIKSLQTYCVYRNMKCPFL